MGMSSWIMDLEEEFEDKVVDIIKESEDISEAYAGAIELNKKHHLVNWSDDEIEEARWFPKEEAVKIAVSEFDIDAINSHLH